MKPSQHTALSIGRIVLYGFDGPEGGIEERPAIVVKVWTPECANLQAIVDGYNDHMFQGITRTPDGAVNAFVWRMSVSPADDQSIPQSNRWRWPPKQGT